MRSASENEVTDRVEVERQERQRLGQVVVVAALGVELGGDRRHVEPVGRMRGRPTGIEPVTPGATVRCSTN
jgi:hypothetical protein